MTSTYTAQHLPQHCTPTTKALYQLSNYFAICIPTPLGFTSLLLGNLSILAWLCAQMPQIYKNFELQSAAGLSIGFLAIWLLGDLTNLIGAVFTEQATWQIALASYYVFVDVCLTSQYLWYDFITPWWRGNGVADGSETDDDNDDASSDLINSLSPINSSFHEHNTEAPKDDEEEPLNKSHVQSVKGPRLTDVHYEKDPLKSSAFITLDLRSELKWPGMSPRTVMYAATVSSLLTQVTAAPTESHKRLYDSGFSPTVHLVGGIISWISTVLYLVSRFPQIYKNWVRKSTTGLSPYLFTATFSGNFFYSASMLVNPNLWYNFGPYGGHGWADEDGSKRLDYITNGAPFFLGAFVVLFQDMIIGLQFLMYNDRQEKVVKVRDRQGVGRWRRVSGWMRGWIPSVRKERIVDLSESQRLLSQSRELDRHSHHSQYGGI